jgi:hypothetical protein
MKPELKAPGTNLLTLEYDEVLSTFAFKFNSRRYALAVEDGRAGDRAHDARLVGRCRLTL